MYRNVYTKDVRVNGSIVHANVYRNGVMVINGYWTIIWKSRIDKLLKRGNKWADKTIIKLQENEHIN